MVTCATEASAPETRRSESVLRHVIHGLTTPHYCNVSLKYTTPHYCNVMSETKSQTDDGRTELPHPSDDPDLRYTHVGKQFEVCGSDVTFEIVDRDTSILPQADGIIIIESESKMIRSEHESDRSGVSRSALAPYEPEAENKAVWTVQGHINAFRNLRIAETDAWSYEDMFWNAQEDGDQ